MPPVASIIIRTKNEERWIASCLTKISEQNIKDIEVILVDNGSTDKTVKRAKTVLPNLRVIQVESFLPGKALNAGIREATGEFIVCLSSHCIPKDDEWLSRFLANFDSDSRIAGVYGRQIPMHFTNYYDKRDLAVTFGLDKRIQKRDPFFHNANSVIPRSVWEHYPFDETVTNIEDRLWAKDLLAQGYYIVYEPEACVYHHHGIYQDRNETRVRNTVRLMEPDISVSRADESNPLFASRLNICAIIPVREEPGISVDVQEHLLQATIKSARESHVVKRIIVTTNSPRIRAIAADLGTEIPFIRPNNLAAEDIQVIDVLKHALEWYEDRGMFFDYIVTMEITHPFRPAAIVDQCIEHALEKGLATVMAGIPEYRPCWWFRDEEYRRIDNYAHRRSERQPLQVGLPALCTVTLPSVLREGKRISEAVGIVELEDPVASIEIRRDEEYKRLQHLITPEPVVAV